MIRVRMISGFLTDDLAIADLSFVEGYVKTEGKIPGEVYDGMIALGIDWEVDYENATDEEYNEWSLTDLVCRGVRAKKMGKTFIFEGEPIIHEELQGKVICFIQQHGHLPDIIADNSQSFILGIAVQEEET